MDAWHVIFAIGAYLAIMKLYSWCQVCYWCSPECDDTWGRRPGRPDRLVDTTEKIEVNDYAGPNHGHDSARVFRDEPALREGSREAVGGNK
ncbi:MAG: hypothetical protein ACYC1M_04015 [Armatimonadota bacterium]